MSKQSKEDRQQNKQSIFIGLAACIVGICLFLFQNLHLASFCIMFGALLAGSGWLLNRLNRPTKSLPHAIIGIAMVLLIVYVIESTSIQKNKSAPKKTVCGKVEGVCISDKPYLSIFTFLPADQHKTMTFPYHHHRHKLEELKGEEICIMYSFDPKWAKHPYIYTVTKK